MYIDITVDLTRYRQTTLDLRVSDRQPVKQLVQTVWKIAGIKSMPRPGYWVRVENKSQMIRGFDILKDKEIANGDKLMIL
ncbi:EsaB/YukD family protein [Terrilactibacillus sp. S3-3]|nr:EsaB/YukD family protein [Terrilactibacillus sp. S3-3]